MEQGVNSLSRNLLKGDEGQSSDEVWLNCLRQSLMGMQVLSNKSEGHARILTFSDSPWDVREEYKIKSTKLWAQIALTDFAG